jgi:hypothetical protein
MIKQWRAPASSLTPIRAIDPKQLHARLLNLTHGIAVCSLSPAPILMPSDPIGCSCSQTALTQEKNFAYASEISLCSA